MRRSSRHLYNLWSEDDLEACREFANGLERPDPWSGDYHERLAEWKEYSKYRTKK